MTSNFHTGDGRHLKLLDLPTEEILRLILYNFKSGKNNQAYIALHVSFFLNLTNPLYIKSLENSYLYADGISVVLAAKFQKFRRISRTATTDLAPILIAELSRDRIDPIRLGLIGGGDLLISRTTSHFIDQYGVDVIFALNGFPDTWTVNQRSQLSSEVDIVFIGMGVPMEQIFLKEIQVNLNSRIILTCGGLFGFLTGNEKRAPKILQDLGSEWLWRLAQSPRRLAGRYFVGLIRFIKFIVRDKLE